MRSKRLPRPRQTFQRRRPRARRFMPLAMTFTLSLATAAGAESVFFTKMTVNDCKEFGTCDWWLSCALGNESEKTFFQMVEADTGDEIEVNRNLLFDELPVTVHCTVKEHDGGIGAGWEDVGSGSITVEEAGEKKIHLDNNEGDVDVEFVVELTDSTSSALTAEESLTDIPSLAALSWRGGRLDVFGRGDDRQIYQSTLEPGQRQRWTEWRTYPGSGTFLSGPAAASRGPNRLDLFALGDDRRIWQSSWNGEGWTGWKANLGPRLFTSAPAVVARGRGGLDLVARDEDRRLRWTTWNGKMWKAWKTIGEGTFLSAPTVLSRGPSGLDVFAVGDDRRLYHAQLGPAGWGPWHVFPGNGTFTSAPTAVTRDGGRIDVFARGDDRRIYHSHWDGAEWSPWAASTDQQIGTFTSAPTAVSPAAGRLELFALGDDRRVWRNSFAGESWTGWGRQIGLGTFR